jgi:hypothetical protein
MRIVNPYDHAGRVVFWPANQTPNSVGLPAISVSGTMSDGSTSARPMTAITQSTLNAVFGWTTNAGVGILETRHNPRMRGWFRTGPSIANVRIFLGFSSMLQHNADAPGAHYAGIRFSTSAADAGFVGVCNGNSTPQTTAKIGDIAADTTYEYGVEVSENGALVNFWIRAAGTEYGEIFPLSSNLPTTTTALYAEGMAVNLAAESKTIKFGALLIEWDGTSNTPFG